MTDRVLLLWLLCTGVLVTLPDARAEEAYGPPVTTPYMIVVTGEELLTGVYADGHTQFITRTLHPLGLTCVGSICVDDKAADMRAALTFAAERAALTLVTGGLGPTAGDITRDVLAEFTGMALKEEPTVVQAMARRFGTSPEKLRVNVRRQARVPVSGTFLKNTTGTAVGLVFEKEEQVIVALPGPPRELQPMVRNELRPYLSHRFHVRTPGVSLTLRFVGLGQSQIAQVLTDHIRLDNQTTATSQFQDSRVDFTFTRSGHTPADQEVLRDMARRLKSHLGDHLYAEGDLSLEELIIQRLQAKDQLLTLAEVGTGGSLAAALTRAQGAQAVLVGTFGAPNLHRLQMLLGGPPPIPVDPQKPMIAVLAEQMMLHGEREWGVVVGEFRVPGGTSGSLQVAILKPQSSVTVHTLAWKDTSVSGRGRLVTKILDLLRRQMN